MMNTYSYACIVTGDEQAQKRRKGCDDEKQGRRENDNFNTNCSYASLDRLIHDGSEGQEKTLESMADDYDDGDYADSIVKDYANVTDGEGDSGESPDGKVVSFPIISSATVLFSNSGDTMMLSDNHVSQGSVHEDHYHNPRPPSPFSSSTTSYDEDLRHRHTIIPLTASHSRSPQDGNSDIDVSATSIYRSTASDHDVPSTVVPRRNDVVDDIDDVVVVDDVVDDNDDDHDNDRALTITRQRSRDRSLSSALSHRDLDCEVRRSCRVRRVQLASPSFTTTENVNTEGKQRLHSSSCDTNDKRPYIPITTPITTTTPTSTTIPTPTIASIADNNQEENGDDGGGFNSHYDNNHDSNHDNNYDVDTRNGGFNSGTSIGEYSSSSISFSMFL